MQKLLLLIAIIWLIGFLYRQLQGNKRQKSQGHVEKMVRCAQCELFLSSNKAIFDNDLAFCCKEHCEEYHSIHN